jgi:hypothetical protein
MVEMLSELAVVGKFMIRPVKLSSLTDWCNYGGLENFIGYMPTIHVLVKGWISFVLCLTSDVKRIMSRRWMWAKLSLMKQLHCCLDPQIEALKVQHLWALLLGFPLEPWNFQALEAMGNKFGKAIFVDECALEVVDKIVVKVPVEVDMRKGLILDMKSIGEILILFREWTTGRSILDAICVEKSDIFNIKVKIIFGKKNPDKSLRSKKNGSARGILWTWMQNPLN